MYFRCAAGEKWFAEVTAGTGRKKTGPFSPRPDRTIAPAGSIPDLPGADLSIFVSFFPHRQIPDKLPLRTKVWRFIMTSIQAAEPGIVFPNTGQAFPAAPRNGMPSLPSGGLETNLNADDLFRSNGITLSDREAAELECLREFLERHVQSHSAWDVQCMLLWSEWVRVFRRRFSAFPELIREQEFRTVITDTFNTSISRDGVRGWVYNGTRYVP